MKDVRDLKVFGEGTLGSGEYKKIKVFGEAFCNGDIDCESISVSGELNIKGKLNVKEDFKILGETKILKEARIKNLKIMGELTTEEKIEVLDFLKVMGQFNLKKDLKVKDSKIMGEVKSEGLIEFENMNVMGELTCDSCQGANFKSNGRLNILSLLSGDVLEIDPYSGSKINEIGGSDILIRRSENNNINILNINIIFNSKSKNKNKKTVINLIEGDNIVLENTICDMVRGENIRILENCEIKKIEYKEKIDIDESSKVGEIKCLKN